MGRKQTIDRDALLDAADRVMQREGTAGLTIDRIAAEAGVSKGGVLYAFATKDAVIDAMFERGIALYETRACLARERLAGKPGERARVHIDATKGETLADATRAMALLAGMGRAENSRNQMHAVYRRIFGDLLATSQNERAARVAMFAAEGMFMLRGFGLLDIPDATWTDIFEDIEALVNQDGAA